MIRELAGTVMTKIVRLGPSFVPEWKCLSRPKGTSAVFRPEMTASAISRLMRPTSCAAADTALRPSGGKARRGASRIMAAQLGEGTDHLHHHPPCWGGRVDVFGKGRLRRAGRPNAIIASTLLVRPASDKRRGNSNTLQAPPEDI
jgi:hypothetical protein